MLPREFACVIEKGLRKAAPLLARTNSQLVNICGRALGDFWPKETIFQLEPEDSDWVCAFKRCVVHSGAHMFYHRHLTYLRRVPKRVALLDQARGSRTQHMSDETFFIGKNLANVHWLMFNVEVTGAHSRRTRQRPDAFGRPC